VTSPPASDPAQPQPSQPAPATPPGPHAIRRTRTGGAWTGLAAGAIVLIFLLIFILENTQQASIGYFGAHGHLPLGVALLLAAVGGALLVIIPGTGRILLIQLALRNRLLPRHYPTVPASQRAYRARLARSASPAAARRHRRPALFLPVLLAAVPVAANNGHRETGHQEIRPVLAGTRKPGLRRRRRPGRNRGRH